MITSDTTIEVTVNDLQLGMYVSNRTQRFSPRIMIICDANKKPYDAPVTLDLRSAGPNSAGVPYTIVNDLSQGAYGIDAKKYYL